MGCGADCLRSCFLIALLLSFRLLRRCLSVCRLFLRRSNSVCVSSSYLFFRGGLDFLFFHIFGSTGGLYKSKGQPRIGWQ